MTGAALLAAAVILWTLRDLLLLLFAAVVLSVRRNLTCTAWNCLVSRQINGVDVEVPRLTINGAPAPAIPEGLPAL